ncbi:MAG: hypothetical protein QXP31_00715 [Pyrobaculum sp.]
MSINLLDFFELLKTYIKKVGQPCNTGKELTLWDDLYMWGDVLYSGGRCIKAPDLTEALRLTAAPACVEKKSARVGPPYLEYFSASDYGLLAALGEDGVYLVENADGAVGCVCKTDVAPDVFKKAVETLSRWLEKIKTISTVGGVAPSV